MADQYKITALPPTIGVKDPETRTFLDALANAWDQRSGNINPDAGERFITKAEFASLSKDVTLDLFATGGSLAINSGTANGNGVTVADLIRDLSDEIKNSLLWRSLTQEFELIKQSNFVEIAGLSSELSAASQQILDLKDGVTDIAVVTVGGATSIRAIKDTVYDPVTGLAAATAAIGEINNISVDSTSAAAKQISTIAAQINHPSTGLAAANANITAINDVSVTSTSAAARALHGIQATVNDSNTGLAAAHSSITALNDVKADSLSANARYLFSVNSSVGQKNKIFFQASPPASTTSYTLRVNDLWFDSDDKNKPHRWSGSAWVVSRDGAIADAQASVDDEIITRASKDSALASAINNIWAVVGGSQAVIQDAGLAEVTPSAAQATKWLQVQAAVTDPNTGEVSSTSIKQDLTSYASSVDGQMNSVYTVRAQVATGGRTIVGGFGLMATNGAGSQLGPTIEFGVRADRFWVGSLSGVGDVPFIVQTAPTTVNGATRPAGTYIKDAFIGVATIDTLKIAGGNVTTMSYGSANGPGVNPGGAAIGAQCAVFMPSNSSGVVLVASVSLLGNTNDASAYLRVMRADNSYLGFTAVSVVKGFRSTFTVSGFDPAPAEGGNLYYLLVENPTSGPGALQGISMYESSIIATGGKR